MKYFRRAATIVEIRNVQTIYTHVGGRGGWGEEVPSRFSWTRNKISHADLSARLSFVPRRARRRDRRERERYVYRFVLLTEHVGPLRMHTCTYVHVCVCFSISHRLKDPCDALVPVEYLFFNALAYVIISRAQKTFCVLHARRHDYAR